MKVIKRNNDIEEFNSQKIFNAVSAAMKSVNCYDEKICENVLSNVVQEFEDEEIIEIEEIQDIIEDVLIKHNLSVVAKEYILYRNERKRIRDLQASMYELSQQEINKILYFIKN